MRKPAQIIALLSEIFPAHKAPAGREGLPLILHELEGLEVSRRISGEEYMRVKSILNAHSPDMERSIIGYEREFLKGLVQILKERDEDGPA